MYIIKVGGGSEINLEGVVKDLATLDQPFVVVLGANALRDRLAQRFGHEKVELTSVSGYSSVFSDVEAIDLIMMAYSGLSNRRFVELCQRNGINAVGLTGLDGRLIQGRRNRGIKVREGGKTLIKRDFSGKPARINEALLKTLLEQEYRPVISIPIIDEAGFAINSENDDIVAALQDSLQANKLIQLIEAPGFLEDKDRETSMIATLSVGELKDREATVEGRMKRKMLALRRLFDSGAAEVIIADGRTEHPVLNALAGQGTTIR
ncbi:MAG TPA: acetylglutamate kinase [Gammaproteobacteria bacterium]|nr:acetylglutamate kinase [Gammaproteobacteria bacterium]|tara:strand:+ start:317 stop:1108 length:792 start_codon:yes stop_codon:yes gene_type:complete